MSRALSALFLSLVLAVTSVTLAAARGQAAGLTEMVICSDGVAVTVTLDAQGHPVDRPRHCPDCLVQTGQAGTAATASVAPVAVSAVRLSPSPRPDLVQRSVPPPAARGPPALV